MRTPKDLKGKTISFQVKHTTTGSRARWTGARTGKVVHVDQGPRKGFVGVTVLTPPPSKSCPCPDPKCSAENNTLPSRLKIERSEIVDVLWFGKLRPLDDWLTS